jgi:alpha-glucosidase (family GH31 glycosyl hydrolase)
LARHNYNSLALDGKLADRTEPYNLEGAYFTMAREAIYARYSYIRQMYTCMYMAARNGGACWEPLFFYYPSDEVLFDIADESFMVAGALKVSP